MPSTEEHFVNRVARYQGHGRTSQRCFRNVSGNDNLAPTIGSWFENFRLQIGRHLRINWEDGQRRWIVQLGQAF